MSLCTLSKTYKPPSSCMTSHSDIIATTVMQELAAVLIFQKKINYLVIRLVSTAPENIVQVTKLFTKKKVHTNECRCIS